MNINQRILDVLSQKGATQKDMCSALGIAPSTLNNWLKLNRSIPSEFLIPICEFLNVEVSWLLTGEGEMRKEASAPAEEPAQKLSMDEKILLNNYRDMDEEDKEKIQKNAARLLSIDKTKNILASPNSTSGEECATTENAN